MLTALLPALIAENSKGHTYITRFSNRLSLKQITHLHSVGILNSMSQGIRISSLFEFNRHNLYNMVGRKNGQNTFMKHYSIYAHKTSSFQHWLLITTFDRKREREGKAGALHASRSILSVLLAKVFAPKLRRDWPHWMMRALLYKMVHLSALNFAQLYRNKRVEQKACVTRSTETYVTKTTPNCTNVDIVLNQRPT
jgi:hypothetical protein